MKERNESIATGVSRRSILRKSAVAGTILGVGSAASGSAIATEGSGYCTIRVKRDDNGKSAADNSSKQGGRQLTVDGISICTEDNLEGRTFEVVEEVDDGPGVCPASQGNTQVRHYIIDLADSPRIASVSGSLPVGSSWEIISGSRCN